MKVSLRDFGRRFRDPFRRAFPCVQYDLQDAPVAVFLAFLAGMHRGDLGFVEGGSLTLAEALARRYAELGGELRKYLLAFSRSGRSGTGHLTRKGRPLWSGYSNELVGLIFNRIYLVAIKNENMGPLPQLRALRGS
ncbi:MAG: hypothetical protein GX493_00365 [Firmicutes bacterium]|nr:hypothetical protein [Bacillota bacterium]